MNENPDYCERCNYDRHECRGCGDPLPHGVETCQGGEGSWFREEYERAKARNALLPPHGRMIVTSPTLSSHVHPRPAGGESDA